ncbi:T9SS type A sorting domain-containing protein [Tamlana sp. 62-3]|uniref:T9SS type A sorting domain-containing protein n=1 Tax=Neotamlana sargassicola TaxID=2883125 RepID=A0A9X1I650_9FLAO|nr:T9SS type A sorting domain-containing protein [Tamlana sargassicola]MCB4808018.1 T9SS type A sorting domain-containing protein [Tamlana sargassicola]
MKKTLLFAFLTTTFLGFSQVQPTVHNATFDNLPKSSGTDCACSGWINKDIADQGESSTLSGNDVVKLDDFESDGIYQEVEVVANSNYTLDLDYTYKIASTTTNYIEVVILKGSGYVSGYTPAYEPPATAAQQDFGYETVASVELAANQLAYAQIAPPGNTDTNAMSQMVFNTGSETSIAIFVRAIGPYDAASHGDSSKDKGWMNGDSEIRLDNLVLVNTTVLSAQEIAESSFKVYPNPAKDVINISALNSVNVESVKLYNVIGKQVYAGDVLTEKIDISNLNKGLYLLKIQAESGSINKKIIIE